MIRHIQNEKYLCDTTVHLCIPFDTVLHNKVYINNKIIIYKSIKWM